MLIIHGPSYRYQGEILREPEIIVIQDHHDSEQGYQLDLLLAASAIPAEQHVLVFDHVNLQDQFGHVPHVCLPLLLAAEIQEFNDAKIDTTWQARTHAFNFMINKPRPNRLILLDTIVHLGLTSFKHSLAWQQDYKTISATHLEFGDEIVMQRGIRNGDHANADTYRCLLKHAVFEGTCVSLITEPAFFGRECMITEKTVMAVWAGTMPLWVGGWRCADFMQMMGFDVFDDVIDHSYQCLSDPAERCRQAILLNQHLLHEPLAMQQYHRRLRANVDLLQQNVFLELVRHQLHRYPILQDLAASYRSGCLHV